MLLYRVAGVLVLQVCFYCARVFANAREWEGGSTATGEWGSWSSWSSCSADCNTGITVRTRRCQHPRHLPVASLLSSADDSVTCSGSGKEIRLCNKQACRNGKKSWREEECSKFDNKVHAGRRYTWEPFIHPTEPCKLTCRAKGHHFYSNLADRVIEGTPCGGATSNPSAVCVHDVCETVGCDDVVGSSLRRDACGVCGGDDTSCRAISGVFTRTDLSRGFNHIIAIPAGSSQINITGLRYSINYLALQIPNGDFILNGGIRRDAAGDYEAAGTLFSYKVHKECAGQCIVAEGPTDQDIDLVLNTRGSNRGVMYSFNVPVNVTDDYFRRIIGSTNTDARILPQRNLARIRGANDVATNTKDTGYQDFNTRSTFNQADSEGEEEDNEDTDDDETEDDVHDDDIDDEDDGDGDLVEEDSDENVDEEDSHENKVITSVRIPLRSLVDPNELGKDSYFNRNHEDDDATVTQSEFDAEDHSPEDRGYWPHEGSYEQSDDDDENDDDDDVDDNDHGDEPGALDGVAQQKRFQITRKQKPQFINPEDNSNNNRGSLSNRASNFEFQANTQKDRNGDMDDDESDAFDITQDPGSFEDLTTEESLEFLDELQTTPSNRRSTGDEVYNKDTNKSDTDSGSSSQESFSADQPQQNSRPKNLPTSQPEHLLRPQSDSPTRPTHYRSQSGGSQPKPWHRLRRPQYSQSFTFRRGHQLNVQAANKNPSSQDRGSPYSRYRSTYSSNPQPPASRQIRFRQQPRGQSASQSHGTSSFSGYERPNYYDRYRGTQPRITAYSRSNPNYNARTRTSSSQRQALTLGQTVSRDQDGTVQVTNTNTRARGSVPTSDASFRRGTPTREESLRLQQQKSRQQEYERQQEEYRRELQRRRQEIEQKRAAQNADYQRRLEEHNRRLRQREREIQERQRQHHRHRHNGHHGRHNNRHRGRQPSVPPSGGIISRTDTNGRATTSSSSQSGGTDPRQRIANTRISSSARPSSSADTRVLPATLDRRQQPVITNRRQPSYIQPALPSTTSTTTTTTTTATSERYVPPTPAPTRGVFTNHAPLPVNPTLPAVIPRTSAFLDKSQVPQYIPEGPGAPQYIPEDPRYNPRSSLTAASSNQLPGIDDNPLVIGSQGNLVPNVFENGLLVGGEGSISAVDSNDKSSYEWRVSGLTDCTLSCGGGMQQTVVVCLDTRTQAVVTDGNCQHVQRPKSKGVTCNTRPCPARWQPTQWSPCSVSCGPGVQSRTVLCLARISATLNLTMPDENCAGEGTKPEERRACENLPCNKWTTGNWSECSVQCGEGVRNRDVICVDQTGFDVSDDLCPGSRPIQEEVCEMGPCGKGWYYTEWPEQCPAECGSGTMSRHVTCLDEGGSPLPDTSCEQDSRPLVQQSCKADVSCGGEWFAGEWEKCNATCGAGYREREVVCMKGLAGGLLSVVEDENCLARDKPDDLEPCEGTKCEAEWYMTSWTECSQSCGTGHRTREVRCLDPSQQPSADCTQEGKPRTREACNTNSCTTKAPSPTPASSDCQDSFSRCEIVKHARMCRFQYYRTKCCATCAEDT